MEEKKSRENQEKALNDEQAVMWKRDYQNYSEEERRLQEKINKINKDNADFLKKQVEDKHSKTKTKMNKQEFLLNKPLLKEINEKKRASQYGGMGNGSKIDEMS